MKNAADKARKFAKDIIGFVKKNPEKTLAYLCAFGLLYAAFLVLLPKPPVYYSVLYLEPGNFGENISGVFARVGIENHEAKDTEYETFFFLDSLNDYNTFDTVLLGKKNYLIKKDANFSGFESFSISNYFKDKNSTRFRIQTSAFGSDYSVHFWLNDKND